MTTNPPPLFDHQKKSIKFLGKQPRVFDMSDAGTGKTRVGIEAFAARRRKKGGCLLVVAPKSLLEAAWREDFNKYAPDMHCVVATATNRAEAFAIDADVYITNHDAVNWLVKQKPAFFKKFDSLEIDECFPAGALVDTPRGPTPIEMLVPGDLVYTSSGALPVSNTMEHMEQRPLVLLEFDDGTTITCTENHPFATPHGWVEAGCLRGLPVLRLDLHKLNQQRATLLQSKLQWESPLGGQDSRGTRGNLGQDSGKITGAPQLEQRNSLQLGYQAAIKCEPQSVGASTDPARRQWTNSTVRTNDARDASPLLGLSVCRPDGRAPWKRLSNFIQARFRATVQALGLGSGRQLAHIAQRLGCEERYLAGFTRVVRISRHESTSPCMVYNLQVNGPHTYSVAGRLVHNCTAFKHHTSARSKAMAKIAKHFTYVRLASATPNSNGICDLWHQMMLIDNGVRLGSSYFGFRSAACNPVQTGPGTQHMKWVDKPGIENIVGALIKDVVIRHRFEDCVDIPANHKYSVSYTLDKKHRALYTEMEEEQLLLLKGKAITAVNAAAVYTKLLQIASGAVYSTEDSYAVVDTKRYDLVLDLVEARAHSVVFFSWKHQRDQLVAAADKRGISFAVFDGSTSDKERAQIVKDFQEGLLQTIFAHPQSAGHGLTLTKGTATIWASPTYNLEHFAQGWKRVHRIGQTQKTETIVVVAENTIDEKVWEVLNNKEASMGDLLNELRELTK